MNMREYVELGREVKVKHFPKMRGKIIEIESEMADITWEFDPVHNCFVYMGLEHGLSRPISVLLELRSGHKLRFSIEEIMLPCPAAEVLFGDEDVQ